MECVNESKAAAFALQVSGLRETSLRRGNAYNRNIESNVFILLIAEIPGEREQESGQ